jgi:hypothetical protein
MLSVIYTGCRRYALYAECSYNECGQYVVYCLIARLHTTLVTVRTYTLVLYVQGK